MTTTHVTDADTAEGVRTAVAAYCHALDDGRVDDLVALFTPDGSSALPGMDPLVGHDALRAFYGTVTPTGPQRHLAVNTLVTAAAGDRVEAVTDLLYLKGGEAGWAVAFVGRYEDVLREVDGRWLFASRSLSFTTL